MCMKTSHSAIFVLVAAITLAALTALQRLDCDWRDCVVAFAQALEVFATERSEPRHDFVGGNIEGPQHTDALHALRLSLSWVETIVVESFVSLDVADKFREQCNTLASPPDIDEEANMHTKLRRGEWNFSCVLSQTMSCEDLFSDLSSQNVEPACRVVSAAAGLGLLKRRFPEGVPHARQTFSITQTGLLVGSASMDISAAHSIGNDQSDGTAVGLANWVRAQSELFFISEAMRVVPKRVGAHHSIDNGRENCNLECDTKDNDEEGADYYTRVFQKPTRSIADKRRTLFDRAMADLTSISVESIVGLTFWQSCGTVCDFGGGDGRLVESLLIAYPHLSAVVADVSKDALEQAEARFAMKGQDFVRRTATATLNLTDGCKVTAVGSDTYGNCENTRRTLGRCDCGLMKGIISDMSNDDALKALSMATRMISTRTDPSARHGQEQRLAVRLMVLDHFLMHSPEIKAERSQNALRNPNGPDCNIVDADHVRSLFDILMMGLMPNGAKQRTVQQFQRLAELAGVEAICLVNVIETKPILVALELHAQRKCKMR